MTSEGRDPGWVLMGLLPLLGLGDYPPGHLRGRADTLEEEEKLIERFGDEYCDSAERTGRFLPRFR